MISVDLSDLLKDLEKLRLDITARFENMVAGIAYDFTLILGENTPVGDEEAIRRKGKYRNYYQMRQNRYRIPKEAGYHAGSWQFSSSGQLVFTTMIVDTRDSAQDAFNEAQATYTLGKPFYIGSTGPGINALEHNYSYQTNSNGIVGPSIQQVMEMFKVDPSKYFK